MPNPTISDVHVQAALTDVSVAYAQNAANFIADLASPIIATRKQSDKYFVYDRDDFLRSDARARAPGAESAGGGFRVSTDTYFCDRFALHMDIADPERENADAALNLDADASEYVTQQIMLKKEKDWATAFFTTSVWDGASSTSDMTGQANPASTSANFRQWNDVASTPIEDIRGEQTAVAKRTGRRPNTLILGAQAWTALADHPDILDRIKHTQKGVTSPELLASLLDLDRVLVSWVTEDTSAEESTAASYSYVAGKNALLAYVEPNPGLRRPSAMYQFVWTAPAGAVRQGARIKKFRLDRNESDRIEGESWYDFKVVGSALGAFFSAAVA